MPPRSAILWEGETQLPGQTGRVAMVVTGLQGSNNRKTGDMPQVWYIPTDQGSLNAAVREGRDKAVCGTCRHRPSIGGACYVTIQWGPQRVWYTYAKGSYPTWSIEEAKANLAGMTVRFGAWGEPPCVPLSYYDALIPCLGDHQGYTHRWRDIDPAWSRYLMASVDSPQEHQEATALGWRTFRVKTANEPLLPGERACPAAEEAGKLLTCVECRQCDGWRKGARRPNRAINLHGFRGASNSRLLQQAFQF